MRHLARIRPVFAAVPIILLFFFLALDSAVGLALMLIMPFAGLPALLFFLTLNASGAVGDLYVVACAGSAGECQSL